MGLHRASVEDIARRVGISQPYVFRLFSTKKNLFKAVVARCFRETLETFQRAAEGKSGREALDAIGKMYADRLWNDPKHLRVQMQAFAACGDPEILDVVRKGVGDLVAYVDRVGGITNEETSRFFGVGMLVNLLAALHLVQGVEPWADRLVAACGSHLPRLD
jgi:AcrR family transcriptional regulator